MNSMNKTISKKLIASVIFIFVLLNTFSTSFAGSWQYDAGGWWYLNDDNTYPAGTWQRIDGEWYCFDDNGFIRTGWIWDNGAFYYCDYYGTMATGWLWDNNCWYYFYPDGHMGTGWLYYDDSWYYLMESGQMASGTVMIDGSEYIFTGNGVLTDYRLNMSTVSAIPAGTILSEEDVANAGEDAFFYTEDISDETFARMAGKSFGENCTVSRTELSYIRCLHRDIYGNIKVGELVMHRMVSDIVCEIFRELYHAGYPIESMLLVDEFNASDDDSIMANNTSAFNYRNVEGTDRLSMHAYGFAIDINPYYNIYYIPSLDYVFPPEGWQYIDREEYFPYKLEPGDLCYELFTQAGFEWGGWWTDSIDYQHFQFFPSVPEI